MREIPKPGERYRHFKNKEYQILAVATHSGNGGKDGCLSGALWRNMASGLDRFLCLWRGRSGKISGGGAEIPV